MPEALPSPDAPQSPLGALCLHCKAQPASKVEGEHGFSLCDSCYFGASLDELVGMAPLPRRSAQDRMIAFLISEVLRLTRELEQSRNVLCGGG